jgi:hypothetical protein
MVKELLFWWWFALQRLPALFNEIFTRASLSAEIVFDYSYPIWPDLLQKSSDTTKDV